MKRIAITNTVIPNTGDAAILLGMRAVLERAFGSELEIRVFDSHPQTSARFYPQFQFCSQPYSELMRSIPSGRMPGRLVSRLHAAVATSAVLLARSRIMSRMALPAVVEATVQMYRDADIVVSTGGTYLVENYALDDRVFDFRLSLSVGKPLVLFTQSLGPFQRPCNVAALRQIFSEAALILLRDERSLRNVLATGAQPRRAIVTPDAAFALADVDMITRRRKERQEGELRIGMSLRKWPYFTNCSAEEGARRYRDAIVAVTKHVIDKYGACVEFVSTCQGIREYWTDDSDLAVEVCSTLSEVHRRRVRVHRGFHTPSELMALFEKVDLVLATRMHAAILAMNVGTPVVGIAYEFKTAELFERLGLGERCCDIENIGGHQLIDCMDDAIARIKEDGERIRLAVLRAREEVLSVANELIRV